MSLEKYRRLSKGPPFAAWERAECRATTDQPHPRPAWIGVEGSGALQGLPRGRHRRTAAYIISGTMSCGAGIGPSWPAAVYIWLKMPPPTDSAVARVSGGRVGEFPATLVDQAEEGLDLLVDE